MASSIVRNTLTFRSTMINVLRPFLTTNETFGKSAISVNKSFAPQFMCQCSPLSTSNVHSVRSKSSSQEGSKLFSTSPAIKYAEDTESTELVEKINSQIRTCETGRLFAVIHIGGRQRKVTTEDIIYLDKHLEADIGEKIRLNKVMLVGGKDFSLIGRPVLNANSVKVEATVLEKTLSYVKIRFFTIKRKDHRRLTPYQIRQTMLRINSIEITPLND